MYIRKGYLLFIVFQNMRKRTRHNSSIFNRRFATYMVLCMIIIAISAGKIPDSIGRDAEPGRIEPIESRDAAEYELSESRASDYELRDLPEYNGEICIELNNDLPVFSEEAKKTLSTAGYEFYSALDALGRCGYCEACVGPETMPEAGREDIWMVHPSGWRSGQGWERCHLIGFQLTGENANDHNLVTGTHSFNVDGMLPYENEVAEAARKGRHVMYRVTPFYKGADLVPRGVHIMARSVEDDSVSFNVFVFNIEPGKTIDYKTGYMR